jgi:alpha-mannosidase/mannosylglycerate hydrolase
MKKFDIFYFSSTHWDREWYQDFQGFRARLVKMTNALLSLLDKDPEYRTFHFDGQTVVLEDYLEIEPERREELAARIREGRILIGPWYVMPDELLVSGESIIRNLMKGHKIAKDFGVEPWKFGYVCDCFGHIAQLPQILSGF